MKTITVHFFKTKGVIIPRLIRLLTFSHWNHVGIEVNGDYFESEYGRGVSKNDRRYFKNSSSILSIEMDITKEQADSLYKFLESQIGMKYDLSAIFALPFRQNWETSNKWFCSEYVAAGLIHSGVLDMKVKPYRVTPRDLFMILSSEKALSE